MTFVTIDLVAGAFTQDQKRELLEHVTEALLAVTGEAMRSLTWVRINEIAAGESAIGGQLLDAETLGRFTARPECVAALKAGATGQRTARELLAEVSAFASAESSADAPPRSGTAPSDDNQLKN